MPDRLQFYRYQISKNNSADTDGSIHLTDRFEDTVKLNSPCEEATSFMDEIDLAKYLITPPQEMDEYDIGDLFDDALNYFHAGGRKCKLTSLIMFQKVIKKNQII